MATHYDITMGNDIARDIHCDVTMSNDVAMCSPPLYRSKDGNSNKSDPITKPVSSVS